MKRVILILILIGFTMNCAIAVPATSQKIEMRINHIQDYGIKGIWLKLELINNSKDYSCINGAVIGLDGDISNDVFLVKRDGVKVPFKGIMLTRSDNYREPMISISPNGRISISLDLSTYYDFSVSGKYEISYDFENISECNKKIYFSDMKSNTIKFTLK